MAAVGELGEFGVCGVEAAWAGCCQSIEPHSKRRPRRGTVLLGAAEVTGAEPVSNIGLYTAVDRVRRLTPRG